MEFEFDPAKSEANKAKHGIDFVAAQELWYDFFAVDADLCTRRKQGGCVSVGSLAIYGQVFTFCGPSGYGLSLYAEREFRRGVAMKTISAEEFDRKFDDGEDISEYVDWSTATRPNLAPVELTITIKRGTKLRLERQAKELGVSVDSLLEDWLREKLDAARPSAAE